MWWSSMPLPKKNYLNDGGRTPPPDVDDMSRHKSAKEDSPRLEPGHTYILALVWERRGWTTMGADSVLPL